MSDVINYERPQVPVKLEDLAQFVLVGRDKLNMVRAGIKALEKLDVAEGVRRQKKDEAAMLAEALLDAEVRIGEILAAMPKDKGGRPSEKTMFTSEPSFTPKYEAARELGFDANQVKRFQTLAENKDIVEQIKQEAREADDLPTRTAVLQAVKSQQKIAIINQAKHDKEAALKNELLNAPEIKKIDAISFLSELDDNSIDLLITDPPYSTDVSDITKFASEWVNVALLKVKKSGRAFICIGAYPEEIKAYFDVLLSQSKFILDNPLIWTYKNTLGITPKNKYNLNYQMILHLYSNESAPLDTSITNEMFSVMEINAPDGRLGDRYHTWQKPDELGLRLVKHASRPEDLIVDCFACTGTFLLMASKLNRRAIGCDISLENLEIAKQRGCKIIG